MEFIKKIWKEISVFGLVFVVFIGLYAYRQATHVELATITASELEEKLKDKEQVIIVYCLSGNRSQKAAIIG